jgi:hypothetical protein
VEAARLQQRIELIEAASRFQMLVHKQDSSVEALSDHLTLLDQSGVELPSPIQQRLLGRLLREKVANLLQKPNERQAEVLVSIVNPWQEHVEGTDSLAGLLEDGEVGGALLKRFRLSNLCLSEDAKSALLAKIALHDIFRPCMALQEEGSDILLWFTTALESALSRSMAALEDPPSILTEVLDVCRAMQSIIRSDETHPAFDEVLRLKPGMAKQCSFSSDVSAMVVRNDWYHAQLESFLQTTGEARVYLPRINKKMQEVKRVKALTTSEELKVIHSAVVLIEETNALLRKGSTSKLRAAVIDILEAGGVDIEGVEDTLKLATKLWPDREKLRQQLQGVLQKQQEGTRRAALEKLKATMATISERGEWQDLQTRVAECRNFVLRDDESDETIRKAIVDSLMALVHKFGAEDFTAADADQLRGRLAAMKEVLGVLGGERFKGEIGRAHV